MTKYTQDDAIRDILNIIESCCTVDDKGNKVVIQSYLQIGSELKKMGISTRRMRESEWERMKRVNSGKVTNG